MNSYYKLLLSFLAVLLFIPLAASAQEVEDSPFYWADTVMVFGQKNIRIPTLNSVAAKMLIPLHSTPASVGVVTRGVFESQHGIILSDALKNISGVNVQNGFGTFDLFLIRGFDSLTSGLVLTDGAAEPEVSFYNLYNIERVEVLKGPGAFLYGGNPLSGAANLVRKQPVFENFANASASYGDFQTVRGTFDLGMASRDSRIAFRLNGLWQESDNYRDDKDDKSYAINPALTWRVDEHSSLTFNFEYVNSDYQPDSGLPLQFNPISASEFRPVLPDVARTRSYQTPLDDSDQEMFRVRLDYQRALNKIMTVRNKFYFTTLDWQTNGTLLNGAFPDAQSNFNVFRTLQRLDDNQKLVGNQVEALFDFNTGAIKHNLVTGFEISRLDDDFTLDVASPAPDFGVNLNLIVDLFNPVDSVTDFNQLSFLPFSSADSRSLVWAPYFVDQATFSEKFQLFFGGRFDVINYDDTRSDFNLITQAPVTAETDRNYERFSPMVGMVVSPVSALSFYANAGQAFAPPSSLVQGNPKPEESTQFEVGSKLKMFDGRLNTTVAIFHLEKENIGFRDETDVTQVPGDQRSRGFELEIAAQPRQSWHTFFSYAFTDAELTKFTETVTAPQSESGFMVVDYSGNTPAFAPKHIVNFWNTKQYRMGFGFGWGIRYVSSQFIDEDNAYEIDDYLTLDASLFYTFDNWRWSVNFKNITDTKYEARGFGSTSVTPANPFAVYGSVDFSL